MAISHEGIVRRGNIYMVDPKSITVEEGWNPRTSFDTPEDLELIESIRTEGVKVPVLLIKTKDDRLVLRDGERRYRAVMALVNEGLEILVPSDIMPAASLNEIEGLKQALLRNTGKPFTPSEEANAFARLQKHGMTVLEISRTMGKSTAYVSDRLTLAQAAPEVRAAVDDKRIYIEQARTIVAEADGNIGTQTEMLKHAVEEREERKAERAEKVRETWGEKNGEKTRKKPAVRSGMTRKQVQELVPVLAEEIKGRDTNGLDADYLLYAKGKLAAYCEVLGIEAPEGVDIEL